MISEKKTLSWFQNLSCLFLAQPNQDMLVEPLMYIASLAAGQAWDVVVYGSSPAGVAAATAAGTLGLKVALYEPLGMLGGMAGAGFLALHDGGMDAVSGLARTFTMLNGVYYNTTEPVQQPESFVSNDSFYRMLTTAGVDHVRLDCRVMNATTTMASSESPSKLASMSVFCEEEPVTATVFIDASYDGDLMVAAKNIPYTSGRESIATYNESLAGARVPGTNKDLGPRTIDALAPDGASFIKYVQNVSTLPAAGEADDALMAFQHRLCVAGRENAVPWPKPEGYDPADLCVGITASMTACRVCAPRIGSSPPLRPALPLPLRRSLPPHAPSLLPLLLSSSSSSSVPYQPHHAAVR